MHILLTNDDGYESPGFAALCGAMRGLGALSLAAPDGQRSTCGHSATLSGQMAVREVDDPRLGRVYAVDGTPVDCVRLAFCELLDNRPDVVISGINVGANVSAVDVYSSGTVAAAREGAFCGAVGIALSQLFKKDRPIDWETSTRVVRSLVPQLLECGAVVRLWNVNLPAVGWGEYPVDVRVVPLSPDHIPLKFKGVTDSVTGRRRYEYAGFYEKRQVTAGTDVAAVFENAVSVTPLAIDATDGRAETLGRRFHI